MRDLFRGYYKPTSEELAEIWKSCIFSFDANVLLHIYCYTPATRERFFEILNQLKERIWIPHQAANDNIKDAYPFCEGKLAIISFHVFRPGS